MADFSCLVSSALRRLIHCCREVQTAIDQIFSDAIHFSRVILAYDISHPTQLLADVELEPLSMRSPLLSSSSALPTAVSCDIETRSVGRPDVVPFLLDSPSATETIESAVGAMFAFAPGYGETCIMAASTPGMGKTHLSYAAREFTFPILIPIADTHPELSDETSPASLFPPWQSLVKQLDDLRKARDVEFDFLASFPHQQAAVNEITAFRATALVRILVCCYVDIAFSVL